MYKKKNNKKKRLLILAIILILLIISFIINVLITNRNLTIFEKTIKDSVLVVEKILSYPIELINNKIKDNKIKDDLYEEYKKLKEKFEEQEITNKQFDEIKKHLKEMEDVLSLNSNLIEYDSIKATVINRNLNYWNESITIDKGESDGILVGMPVIVKNGLIGQVVSTTTFNSTIKLLTSNDKNDKISVKIKNGDEYIYGLLSGYNKEDNTYIIEGIKENIKIEKDSLVTTTGMGNIFPAGIVIGKIVGSDTDKFDLAAVLEMKSEVDFNNLNYVVLLKRNSI